MSASQTNLGVGATATLSTSAIQTLLAETIVENSCGFVQSTVSARRVSDGASKVFNIQAGFKRDGGDVTVFGVSLLNALGTTLDLIALAAVAATIDAAGDDVRVRVTGLASQDIDWSANLVGLTVNHE